MSSFDSRGSFCGRYEFLYIFYRTDNHLRADESKRGTQTRRDRLNCPNQSGKKKGAHCSTRYACRAASRHGGRDQCKPS